MSEKMKRNGNSEMSPFLLRLLEARGIGASEARDFLFPDYERGIHDPFLFGGMRRAVERILSAMERKERIAIYGDYDCDGIPGAVVLHDALAKTGYENFRVYIPHRHKEGYGLNAEALKTLAAEGVRLIITVDCGITDVREVEEARKLGCDVIITDHHIPGDVLPAAEAILNPKLPGDPYPEKMLSGAGVAWKLACALFSAGEERKAFSVPDGWEKWLLDMAGLATIADMVPLTGENRIIARFGLVVLAKSPRPGLRKLCSLMRVSQERITEDDVAFMIAPRINAASRMGVPFDAFRLLSTRDEAEAARKAELLHRMNDERKWTVAHIVKEAKKKIARRRDGSVIVVGDPRWRIGVLGIVAGNLCEEYGKPAFVWGREGDGDIKGSCRSDGSVDVVELLSSVTDGFFLDAGGHELSGGFSVSHERVHFLEEEIAAAYAKVRREKKENLFSPDLPLSLSDVSEDTYSDISLLAPFGIGNPKPLFSFDNVSVAGVFPFGKEKNHIRVSFTGHGGARRDAIAFFAAEDSFSAPLREGERVRLIASMEKTFFRGFPELRLRISDILPPDA